MATLYVDLINGVDSMQGTKSTTLSNPSGTLVRGTSTAHGYSNGDTIFLSTNTTSLLTMAITGFYFTIYNVTANTFDLTDAVWPTGLTGTVSTNANKYLRGTSPSTPIKSTAYGYGNSITKVKKSDDPFSIGDATWTTKSATITLAAARTQTVDNCEIVWTAANAATVARDTTYKKQGTSSMKITTPAATAINTKYAYYTLPATLNLSAYQNISFQLYSQSGNISANRFKLCLCSDTLGNTVVDTIDFQSNANTSGFHAYSIPRTGGGNLGNNIASIALYTAGVSPGNNFIIFIDGIIATKTNDIDLTTLLTKSPTATWHNTEQIVPIQSIDGTTVTIDNGIACFSTTRTLNSAANLKGYYTLGTSPETVTTYAIKPLELLEFANTYNFSNTSGFGVGNNSYSGNYSKLSGGWDFTTDTQNGLTWLDSKGSAFAFPNTGIGCQFDNFGFARNTSVNLTNSTDTDAQKFDWIMDKLTFVSSGSNSSGFAWPIRNSVSGLYQFNNINGYNMGVGFRCDGSSASLSKSNNWKLIGNNAGSTFTNYISNLTVWNNFGVSYSSGTTPQVIDTAEFRHLGSATFDGFSSSTAYPQVFVKDLTFLDASSGGASRSLRGNNTVSTWVLLKNVTTDSGSSPSMPNNGYGRAINSNIALSGTSNAFTGWGSLKGNVFWEYNLYNGNERVNNDPNDNRINGSGISWFSQTSTVHTPGSVAWQMSITSTSFTYNDKFTNTNWSLFPVATIACTGNKAVTVKAWVKKSSATGMGAALVVRNWQYGITNTVITTKADDTNWEELTVTFTPTARTVVTVEFYGWYVSNTTSSIYIDDITVTEAA